MIPRPDRSSRVFLGRAISHFPRPLASRMRFEYTTLVWTVSLDRTFAPPAGAIVARRAAQSFRMATSSTTNRYCWSRASQNKTRPQHARNLAGVSRTNLLLGRRRHGRADRGCAIRLLHSARYAVRVDPLVALNDAETT